MINLCFSLPFLCDSAVKSSFAFSAAVSRSSAATAQQLRRGGHDRAFRRMSAISAALAELATMQKCQFSGFSAASRLSFRRIKCKLCNKKGCRSNPLISVVNSLPINSEGVIFENFTFAYGCTLAQATNPKSLARRTETELISSRSSSASPCVEPTPPPLAV